MPHPGMMEGMMGPPGPGMEGMMPPGGQFPPGQFPPWMQAGMAGGKAKKRGRKKKKLNQNTNMNMNSVLDRTSPCPNVDVRHMHPPPLHHPGGPNPQLSPLSGGAIPATHPGMNPGQQQPGMYPSFLENPTSFLAQQAAFVSNSLNTSAQQQHDLDISMSSTTSSQHGDQSSSNQGDQSNNNIHGDNSLSSTQSSPASSRQSYTLGKSPPLSAKSPPVSMGQYPCTASPHINMPSPTSKSTPTQSTPKSRRSSQGSHSGPSPSVTPRPGLPLTSPHNESIGLHDSSSSSTATATSGESLLESPTSTPHVSTPSGPHLSNPAGSGPATGKQSQDVITNRIKTEPGLTLTNPGFSNNPNLTNPAGTSVKKTGKSGKNKGVGGAKSKQTGQNQMNLNSFSNALEFQQILANKYGPGSFPASSLLTAAAKAQSNHPNPLAQAISQLQHAFQGNANSKGMKNNGLANIVPGCSSSNSGTNSQDQSGSSKKDDFHASSFLVGEGGRLDSGEAMAALLSQMGLGNIANTNAAQLMLQQISGFQQQHLTGGGDGESGTVPSSDPEQLAASQMAMINMAAAGLAAANGNSRPGAGNTSAAPSGGSGMITGLEATENAIMKAFNSEDPGTVPSLNTNRNARRRSAPGQQDDSGPGGKKPCPSRPSSAPGGQGAIQAGLISTCGTHSSSHPQIAHMLQRGMVSMATNTNTASMATNANAATSPIATNTTQALPGNNKTSLTTSGPIISQAAVTTVTSSLSQSIPSISITPGTSLSHAPGASLSQPGALSPMSANSNEPITVTLEATGEQVTIPPLSEILLATPEQLSRLSPQQLAAMQQLIQQQLQLHSQNMQNMQQQGQVQQGQVQPGQAQQAPVTPQQTIIPPGQQGEGSLPPSDVVQTPGMGAVMFQTPMPPFQQPGAVTMQQMSDMGMGALPQGQQIVGLNMDAMTQLQLNPLCIPMPPQTQAMPQSHEHRTAKQASPRKPRVSPKKYGQKKTADGRPISVDGRIISNISSIEESINAVVNQSYEEEDEGQGQKEGQTDKTPASQDNTGKESTADSTTSKSGNHQVFSLSNRANIT